MSDRRVYTEEYKREAVRLAQESGNLSGTARNLGINPTILQRWKKALATDKPNPFPGQGNPADRNWLACSGRTRACRKR